MRQNNIFVIPPSGSNPDVLASLIEHVSKALSSDTVNPRTESDLQKKYTRLEDAHKRLVAQHANLNGHLDQMMQSLDQLYSRNEDVKPLEIAFPLDRAKLDLWKEKLDLFLTTSAHYAYTRANLSNLCPTISLPTGPYYRLHRKRYSHLAGNSDAILNATSITGSRYSSPGRQTLFVTSDILTLFFETLLYQTPIKPLDFYPMQEFCLTTVNLNLSRIADLTNPMVLHSMNLKYGDLVGQSWEIPQKLGDTLFNAGYQAIKVPSSTRIGGYYVVIFPESISTGDVIFTGEYNLEDVA